MKKEYLFVFIGGLFLLSYILEAVVNPLPNAFATPYEFLRPGNLFRFPFTTADIFIKSLGIFLTPLFVLSFLNGGHAIKAISLFILAGLLQLYAIQEVVTGAKVMPLEWSLSFAFASVALVLPAFLQLLLGLAHKTKEKFSSKKSSSSPPLENQS